MPIKEHMPERRFEDRLLCADVVSIEWKDKSGWTRATNALLEDISSAGACLQTDFPIPARAQVNIRHGKGFLPGEVRYCAFRELGYFVGLAFGEEHRWSRRMFRPKHLLDVRRLTAKSIVQVRAAS